MVPAFSSGPAMRRRRGSPSVRALCITLGVLCAATSGCGRISRSGSGTASGGDLVVAERSGPRTFNPVLASDNPSKAVLGHLFADLIHINRQTQRTEPALAESWDVSPDGRTFRIHLRPGLRFADGHPCTGEDVAFSFQVYLDEAVHAPQRDLLLVGGTPLGVRVLDPATVEFTLTEPYAAAERLFDGIAILPKHLLADAYAKGDFPRTWGVDAPPASIIGTGPFTLTAYVPGDRLVLTRNPHYWKHATDGTRLPYLDRLIVRLMPSEDAEVLRFSAGDIDVLNRVGADAFASLADMQTERQQLVDAGPSLEYNFLFFNLNDPPPGGSPVHGQTWFRNEAFRHAVSAVVDRDAIVRLVYRGRGEALWGPVTSGNRQWLNGAIPHESRSIERARARLSEAGFSWRHDGTLLDPAGMPVSFSLLVASTNVPRMQMATLVQDDLADIGIRVTITPVEFRAAVDRVLTSKDYEAAIFGLVSGDTDPNGDINVWLSSGGTHLWRPGGASPATPWEAEIDELMRRQVGTRDVAERTRLYDRVQALLAEHEPMVFLASPHVLAAANARLDGFHPAALPHYTLWNVDELRWRQEGARRP